MGGIILINNLQNFKKHENELLKNILNNEELS